MGLDVNGVRSLLYARTLNVDFSRTAMIGRQCLHLTKADMRGSLQHFGYSVGPEQIDSIFSNSYAEPFLSFLGSRDVHSFDYSPYEGATRIHDMNVAVPTDLKGQYSVVLDSGSLEHVFNVPVAIKNCMEMLHVGGHYVAITPTNNFLGHGFYQFSPELFFSVFTPENGFDLVSVVAFEDRPDATWYPSRTPRSSGGGSLLLIVSSCSCWSSPRKLRTPWSSASRRSRAITCPPGIKASAPRRMDPGFMAFGPASRRGR